MQACIRLDNLFGGKIDSRRVSSRRGDGVVDTQEVGGRGVGGMHSVIIILSLLCLFSILSQRIKTLVVEGNGGKKK